ncbi:GMC oxidoreductase [Roseococcus sp. YIM B11640]|uniref:GMC oxidoreductase n=1 Tax=Roseococcus sp. YIM B11640 TaxID=3133973 RepID=UPI003C7A303D
MLEDARHIPGGSTLAADVCIAGGGAAGITLALALMDSGLDVVLLAGGGEKSDKAAQALYEGEVADAGLHPTPDRYRVRGLGGSTKLWGGRCVPFDPIDFERRDYIAHSGWPIGPEALRPYYPLANLLCDAGAFAYTAAEAFPEAPPPMLGGFESADFSTDTLERFSLPTDFARRYRPELERGPVRVLLNASLCSLGTSPDGRHAGPAQIRTLGGNAFSVEARTYVMAAGGLESARLLLASPGASGRGLGNAHDVVGRYYMCHLAGTIGTVDLSGAASAWHGYDLSPEGVYCRRRIALRPGAQRALRAGNFVARLHHPRIPDPGHGIGILSALYLARPIIPYEYGKRLYGDEPFSTRLALAHVRNLLTDAPGTAAFLWNWLRRRTLARRKFPSVIVRPRNLRFSLDFHAEQEPDPESRITLGNETDALGVRRLRVEWRYSRQDVQTVSTALAAFAQALQENNTGCFEYEPERVEEEMTRYGAYGGHHIGTARMGTDPRSSVVDADCRLHEASNVFVAGAAVFPTSSQANPTLTVVALALRLADHLKRELAGGAT